LRDQDHEERLPLVQPKSFCWCSPTPTVDPAKLRPASFTQIALEEPENSLSPHYVGRVERGRIEAKVKNGGRVLEPHKRCTRAVIPGWPGRARC